VNSLLTRKQLCGTYTAIVTPFTQKGEVDWSRLRDLIEWQIASGVDGLVPVGTTGESPTLSMEEHARVVEETIALVRGRCRVIAGTGANATSEALELTRHARDAGADATLQVTPYYNRPTAAGLVAHFTAVADLGLPVVLYNVPGRTGREIPIEVVLELAKHPGVIGIKEAAGNVDRVSQIVRRSDLAVLCGDDALALPMIAVGAQGLISVASNVVPGEVVALVRAALEGRLQEARERHLRLHPLFGALFVETNPIPVKAALAMMGRIEEMYRLPLCPMEPANRRALESVLHALGLIGG